jgi:drug/metabolite transporter (DMT)-like permease
MDLIFYSLIVSLFWGISPVLYKMIMNKVDTKLTFIINNIFFTLAVIIYTIYYWDQIKSEAKNISIRDTLAIGAIAIVMSFIPNVIYYNLINDHDSYIVSALVNSAPIFTVGVSYLLLKENITKYGILGTILIIVGVICLSV